MTLLRETTKASRNTKHVQKGKVCPATKSSDRIFSVKKWIHLSQINKFGEETL